MSHPINEIYQEELYAQGMSEKEIRELMQDSPLPVDEEDVKWAVMEKVRDFFGDYPEPIEISDYSEGSHE